MFIKSLHQLPKPNGLVRNFHKIQKGNKAYNSNDAVLCQLKEDIGEPIETIYVRDITEITTKDDNNDKLLLPHHTSKHQ